LLRVVRCLPSNAWLSCCDKTWGQASDKPRGRKPRDHRRELGSATVYGDLNDGSVSNPANKPLCRAMTVLIRPSLRPMWAVFRCRRGPESEIFRHQAKPFPIGGCRCSSGRWFGVWLVRLLMGHLPAEAAHE
jgi:hypothetical protein